MKKKVAIFILSILVALPLISAIFPRDYADYLQRPLKEKPDFTLESLSNGLYMSAIEDYLSDRFAFKPEFLSLRAYVTYAMGQRDYDNIIAGSRLYQKPLDNTRAEKFAQNNGVKVFAIPYKINFAKDLPLAIKLTSIQDEIRKKYFLLADDDLRDFFIMDDYYKGDHHLNDQGLKKLINKLNLNYDYVTTDTYDFRGGLSRKTGFVVKDSFTGIYIEDFKDKKALADGKEISLYNFDRLTSADPYLFYVGGNYGLVDIEGEGQGNVTIIKDSFANPLLPFFAKKYANVRAIDPRFLRAKIEDRILDGEIYVIGGF